MKNLANRLISGILKLFGDSSLSNRFRAADFDKPYALHLGPGPNWIKPSKNWINVDIDPDRGDMIVDFNKFRTFPLDSNTVAHIYGSHVFEHMSIYVTDAVFSECFRVLQPGGVIRLILPDVEKSIREYLAGNMDFSLFKRRKKRAKIIMG